MITSCDIETIALPNSYPKDQQTVITIGNFDGVHLGHAALLQTMRVHARRLSAKSVVITFEPHPQKTLKGSTPTPLVTKEEKLALLKASGVDLILQLDFSLQVASMDTEAFIQRILLKKLRMKELILGHDFSMGRNQTGTKDVIAKLGKALDFTVTSVPPVLARNETVSSSLIRKKLTQGMVAEAAAMLGRPYVIAGTVTPGEKRGQKLGFPTINLLQPTILSPPQGVYVTLVTLPHYNISTKSKPLENAKNIFLGVTNIGTQPTFKKEKPLLIETHILNFSGTLYDKPVAIAFLERLRSEQFFEDPSLLAKQIRSDILQAEQIFKNSVGLILE